MVSEANSKELKYVKKIKPSARPARPRKLKTQCFQVSKAMTGSLYHHYWNTYAQIWTTDLLKSIVKPAKAPLRDRRES